MPQLLFQLSATKQDKTLKYERLWKVTVVTSDVSLRVNICKKKFWSYLSKACGCFNEISSSSWLLQFLSLPFCSVAVIWMECSQKSQPCKAPKPSQSFNRRRNSVYPLVTNIAMEYIPILNRKCIFKGSIFHYYVSHVHLWLILPSSPCLVHLRWRIWGHRIATLAAFMITWNVAGQILRFQGIWCWAWNYLALSSKFIWNDSGVIILPTQTLQIYHTFAWFKIPSKKWVHLINDPSDGTFCIYEKLPSKGAIGWNLQIVRRLISSALKATHSTNRDHHFSPTKNDKPTQTLENIFQPSTYIPKSSKSLCGDMGTGEIMAAMAVWKLNDIGEKARQLMQHCHEF